jgi:phage tail P2-like protein
MSDRSSTLLPLSSTRLERALAAFVSRRFDDLPVPIRDLWNADTCPADMLSWLAWSRSVDVWEEDWSEAHKRAVIRESFQIHCQKGTVGAVRRALEALDIGSHITEWWQDGAPRGTFKIDAFAERIFAQDGSIDQALLDTITQVVERTKRLSQHYTVRVGERFAARSFVRASVNTRTRHNQVLPLRPAAEIETARMRIRSSFADKIRDHLTLFFSASVA